ncbi:MAG: hypothetical protein ACXAB2_13050, partial [Candidatus Hodarchaeales archaeon]
MGQYEEVEKNWLGTVFDPERMICQVCKEEITDHRYFCILDPRTSKYHFYHSKGRCLERLLNVSQIRAKWL